MLRTAAAELGVYGVARAHPVVATQFEERAAIANTEGLGKIEHEGLLPLFGSRTRAPPRRRLGLGAVCARVRPRQLPRGILEGDGAAVPSRKLRQ